MSLSSEFQQLKRAHGHFLRELEASSRFDPSSPASIVPTLLFMAGSFCVLYGLIHRHTFPSTPLHIRLYREIGFHWTFFYVIRVWLLLLKLVRIADESLQKNFLENHRGLTAFNIHLLSNLLVISLGITPILLFVFNYACRRNHVPNFLMWVGEDPWLHSEIGVAGHYLDRPPNFPLPERTDCAYRVHRSSSYGSVKEKLRIMRSSRSLDTVKRVTRIEDLLN